MTHLQRRPVKQQVGMIYVKLTGQKELLLCADRQANGQRTVDPPPLTQGNTFYS